MRSHQEGMGFCFSPNVLRFTPYDKDLRYVYSPKPWRRQGRVFNRNRAQTN